MNKKCQVFTPADSVADLLDLVGYTSNVFGKKIIENACGDGSILQEIVKRYIKDCQINNKSIAKIKLGLERDIYGAEIDEEHHINCLENLDRTAKAFGIRNIRWNVTCEDILKKQDREYFDFVVGNPPYISYRDLDIETRKFINNTFSSCKHGKFDYCYAFIEHSIESLKPDGKMAYLIPNSIFKNVFAEDLRKIILPHLIKIIDYKSKRLFENALTSSAILVCQKDSNSTLTLYENVVQSSTKMINKEKLIGKWVFHSKDSKCTKKMFGNYFHASVGVATLYNKAFVINNIEITEGDLKSRIEKSLVKEAASPRALNYGKKEFIIFPYWYNKDNSLMKYSATEFEEKFPKGTEYLNLFRSELHARNSDKSAKWFEYGRSQALSHLNQEKLLLSTIITREVKVYKLSKGSIPYSGIYIVPLGGSELSEAKKILESKRFFEYVKNIGINANGDSLRITAVDINKYMY